MRGQLLGVDARTGDGMVAGEDGRRYAFAPGDWAGRGEPAIGLQVDFETADNRALGLFPGARRDARAAVGPARRRARHRP